MNWIKGRIEIPINTFGLFQNHPLQSHRTRFQVKLGDVARLDHQWKHSGNHIIETNQLIRCWILSHSSHQPWSQLFCLWSFVQAEKTTPKSKENRFMCTWTLRQLYKSVYQAERVYWKMPPSWEKRAIVGEWRRISQPLLCQCLLLFFQSTLWRWNT